MNATSGEKGENIWSFSLIPSYLQIKSMTISDDSKDTNRREDESNCCGVVTKSPEGERSAGNETLPEMRGKLVINNADHGICGQRNKSENTMRGKLCGQHSEAKHYAPNSGTNLSLQIKPPKALSVEFTAACAAIVEGDSEPVKKYLASGGDPNRKLSGQELDLFESHGVFETGVTLFKLAVRFKRKAVAALLVDSMRTIDEKLVRDALRFKPPQKRVRAKCTKTRLEINSSTFETRKGTDGALFHGVNGTARGIDGAGGAFVGDNWRATDCYVGVGGGGGGGGSS